MASHSHSQSPEDVVTERRLKPIYDNLDNGNYKAAMQSADKLLKKHKDLHCAKVLKALALLRLDRTEECEALAQTVVVMKPTDEPTLQALSICFREMNKVELIVEIFSNAVKSHPTEEYYTHLFMALVRIEKFKEQQQTAMALYKAVSKNPYYFWAVVSAVLQALTIEDSNLAQKMLLPLAEKMVEKMIEKDKIEAEAELNLYLLILDLLGKHEKALELVESKLGKSLLVSEIPCLAERVAELHLKMQKWDKAIQAYRKLLIDSPDNWMYYINYLTSAFKHQENGWQTSKTPSEDGNMDILDRTIIPKGDSNSQTDHVFNQLSSFIQERVHTENKKLQIINEKPLRGPFLAQMELISRLSSHGKEDLISHLGYNLKDVLIHYFELFGDKICCFSDIATYLALVPDDERVPLVEHIEQQIGLISNDGQLVYATSVKQLQRHLTLIKICRFFGYHERLSYEKKSGLCSELVCRYKDGLKFGTKLLQTDLQYSDEYLLLAVHILIDLWIETGDDNVIWQCLVLLELGHKNSSSSHHFKLLLMRFYCLSGVFSPVPDLYESLDVKHMQQDTLGYIAMKYVKSLGQLSSASSLYNDTLRFFVSGHKDVTEYMIASYRFGTYQKIPEFLKFSKKISHSMYYAQTTVEKMLLDILLDSERDGNSFSEVIDDMEIKPDKDQTEWDKLTDQRDLNVMLSWNPPKRSVTAEDRLKSFKQEKHWLMIRSLLLRLLATASHLHPPPHRVGPAEAHTNDANRTEDEDDFDAAEVMSGLISELDECLEKTNTDDVTRIKFPVCGPLSPLTEEYLDGNLGQVILHTCNLVQEAFVINSSNADDSSAFLQDSFCLHCNKLRDTLRDTLTRSRRGLIKEDGDQRIFDSPVLTELSLLTETVVYVIYLMGVAHRNMQVLKNRIQKKNRKKKNVSKPLPPCISKYKTTLEEVGQILQDLQTAIKDLDAGSLSLQLSQLKLTNKIVEDEKYKATEATLWKTVSGSYQQSSKELSDLLKNKMEYFAKLKL